jgi:hypothetical protein
VVVVAPDPADVVVVAAGLWLVEHDTTSTIAAKTSATLPGARPVLMISPKD